MRSSTLQEKEAALLEQLQTAGSMIVAYSGGVDSSLLAHYARRALGHRALIVIAVSPSLAQEELDAARQQAALQSWDLLEITTDEVSKEEYAKNDGQRCYFCKSTLFDALDELAEKKGIAAVAYGANVDDLRDFRPGHRAAREHKVLSPLQEAQLTKAEIRQLARAAALPSWDRPQAACLSSRFPTFQPVTIEGLAQVETAESFLHGLGFRQVRVRHYNETASIEVDCDELPRLIGDAELMRKVDSRLKAIGYKNVIVDPEGYRQGSANRPAGSVQPGGSTHG